MRRVAEPGNPGDPQFHGLPGCLPPALPPALLSALPRLYGLAPLAGPATRLLLLGSFPGRASLAAQQYYGHARNHFWPILGALWGIDLAARPYADRLALLEGKGLGLWDVYASCQREGSLDSAIEAAKANDLAGLARRLPQLQAVAHNGGESARAMRVTRALGLPVYRLPSTSPANASWSFERKRAAWAEVFAKHGMLPASQGNVALPLTLIPSGDGRLRPALGRT